ncbi:hypothetical protein XENOCAPTIV_001445, partial [Xenoophorus captivus]
EEQIEPAPGGNSTLQSDSSWKIPPSSHVLMRASQVSSEIREGDESYLRLSLGQFFGQRSEALGCLGSVDGDDVKRVSKYYNNSSQLMLSISTIASAIANASVSTDPSQLAAMIVDLSKRNKARNRPEFVAKHQQGPSTAQHPEQSTIPDILQRSICVGEMSAFDIEKYLKTNMSSTSHSSEAHTTFDLSSWAEGLSSSQKNPQAENPTKQDGVTPEIPLSTKTEKDNRGNMTLANTSSAAVQVSNDESKSIPIPCSCASLSPTRRTVDSGQYSHLSCSANKLKPNEETTASSSQASNSAARTSTETVVKLGERNTKTNTRSLEAFCKNDKNLPRTSQSWKKSQSGLPVLKASSSPTQRLRNVGQELQDRSRDSPEKNVPGNITATPLPQSSEKQAEISGLNAQPSRDPLSGFLVKVYLLIYCSQRESMGLSTTIIRFSPTPPVEPDLQSNLNTVSLPKGLDDVKPRHSKSLDPLPAPQCKSPEVPYSGPALSCTRSQSECNYPGPGDILPGFTGHKNLSVSDTRKLAKVDSGYSSNLNIQQTISSAAPPGSQQWGAVPSMSSSLYAGGLGLPPPYSAEGLHYVQIPGLKPQCPGMVDLPHKGDIQSLLTRRTLVSSQLPLQYLGPEAPLHSGAFHLGPSGNRLYSVSKLPLSVNSLLLSSSGQVVVPEELRFPHACCVGIASQTSLSLFNPSERWQQVSITVASLAVDGEQVDSLPYQWLIVKNKTIIGPKSTEEQKVLFVPPQPGVYQCVLSVCSWPASAETELTARAGIFAKRVVLIAVAENPALELMSTTLGWTLKWTLQVLVVLSEVFPSRPSLEQQESMLLKIYR